MSGNSFVENDLRRGLCVVFVMGAWDGFCEFGEVVNYDQQSSITRVGLTEFQMVKLHQIVEVAAAYALHRVAGASRWRLVC